MPNKIGATIALDGEKEFKAAIRDADSQMKLLKSELKLTGEQFAKNTGSLKSYQAQNEVLTKQVQAQQGKVDALKQALDHAKEAYGENSTQARHWQTQLNNAQADLVKMNRELDDVQKHAKGVGALKTEFEQAKEKINAAKDKIESARQHLEKLHSVADGVGNVLKAGFSAGLSAGTAALTAIGTAAVAAGKKVWDMAQEVSAAGDEIEKNSQKVGMSYSAYQKWDYAMKISGTEMSSCANGLKTLSNKFDDAIGGSKSSAEIFDRLGISLDSLKNKSREDVFSTVVQSLQNVTDETTKAALANDLFGKSGQELMPMFNLTNEELAGLMQQAEDYGMVMSDDAVKASADFKDSLTRMKGTMTGLKNEMTGRLLPGLTQLTGGFTELLNGNPDAGIEMISGAVRDLLAQVEELAPTVLQLGGELLQALAEAVLENAPVLVETGTPIIIELIGGILDNLDLLLDAALQLVEYLLDAIDNNSDQLASMAIILIRKLTTGLLGMLPQLVSVGVDLIVSLVEGLSDPEMAEEIIHAAVECAEALIGGLADKAEDLLNAGKHLVEGIWQGISNSYEWIKEKLTGWVGNVLTFLKNLFGIKSPSTVMRDVIGKNLMLGLGEGIDEYAKIPQDAMEKMSASLVAGSDYTYAVNGVYDQIGAAGPQSMTMTSAAGAAGTGAPSLETVIALLQVIASQGGRPIMLNDGTLLGWMDSALGQASSRSERGVAN